MKSLYESILDDEEVLIKNVKGLNGDPFTIMKTLFNSGLKPAEIDKLLQEREIIFMDWIKRNFPAFNKIPLKLKLYSERDWDDRTKCESIRMTAIADVSVSNRNRIVDNELLGIIYRESKLSVSIRVSRLDLKFAESGRKCRIGTRILKKIDFDELDINKETVMKKYGLKYDIYYDGSESNNILVKKM